MRDYKRIARKHARQALKEFFEKKDILFDDCNCPDEPCLECLKQKALDIFYDFQLREAMDPDSNFAAPPDRKSEKEYNETAVSLISRTVERAVKNTGRKDGMITCPEEAYNTGCEIMGDIVNEVCDHLMPEDYEGSVKENVREKAWKLFEEKLGADIPVPAVHAAIKEYYDRGIHDTLHTFEPPEVPTPTHQLLHILPEARAARYENLLMAM